MAGINFFLARSPVTPKITIPEGPAIRGSRLSRGSRRGLVVMETMSVVVSFHRTCGSTEPLAEPGAAIAAMRRPRPGRLLLLRQLLAHRFQEFFPGLDEFLDTLGFQHVEDVGEVDADGLQGGEHRGRLCV